MENRGINITIKAISVIYFLGAVLDFFIGLGLFFARDSVIGMFPSYLANYSYPLGVIQIGLGIFGLFITVALWKTKRWARIAVLVIGTVEILFSISEILTRSGSYGSIIFNIVLYLAIMLFLLNNKVKTAFK
jgi:uncharacterized membrane protein (DUF2068 family)